MSVFPIPSFSLPIPPIPSFPQIGPLPAWSQSAWSASWSPDGQIVCKPAHPHAMLASPLYAAALEYMRLGYDVGLTGGKHMWKQADAFSASEPGYDGISLLTRGRLCCLDVDAKIETRELELALPGSVPDTVVEDTPRGRHYFYRLPDGFAPLGPRINYRTDPKVDILCEMPLSPEMLIKYGSNYAQMHALVSPTPGYARVRPKEMPRLEELALAPGWMLEEMAKPLEEDVHDVALSNEL